MTTTLSNGEEIVARFRLHWVVWIRVWVLYMLLLTSPLAAYIHIYLRNLEFGLTNRRVVRKEGWIARRTAEMKLQAVETVTIRQTAWGRILGYGTVIVTGKTAGISDVRFERISNPIWVKKAIDNAKYADVAPSAPAPAEEDVPTSVPAAV